MLDHDGQDEVTQRNQVGGSACPHCGAQIQPGQARCAACRGNLVVRLAPGGQLLLGRYRIVRRLAHGGMSSIYLGQDERLGSAPVAVKEMQLQQSPLEPEAFQEALELFRREAELLARLSHAYLPRVIDQFEEGGKQFLVMEYVQGETLRQHVERAGRPDLAQVLVWVGQLAEVLGYLHGQEPPIVYRDLKPANVMVRPDGRLVLIDFGIARFYKQGQSSDTVQFGTLGYAPPEQYGQDQTDPRTDIYALGVLTHHLLTGHDPGSTPFRLPPLRELRPDLPTGLTAVVRRATSSDPDERFPTMQAFWTALSTAARQEERFVRATVPQQSIAPASYQPALPATERSGQAPAQSGQRRWLYSALALLVLALSSAGVFLLLDGPRFGSGTITPDGAGEQVPVSQATATRGLGRPTRLEPILPPSAQDTAADSKDLCGNNVTYLPENAVDGRPETAWRVDGDGIGTWIELKFEQPVIITSVALIPGHDKVDPCDATVDRFLNSRIVRRVRLEFDDNQDVEAGLEPSRELQAIEVPQLRSQRVRVVILETQEPKGGPHARDFTPISEIEVRGVVEDQ